jgi:hypothetical protein
MVAQPAASVAAVSGSGEESALGEAPAEEIQEQDAPSMMAMMALLVEKVGGIQDAVDQVSARTMVLEGAMADASMSSGEELPTGRGSESAVTMVTASSGRWERAPDQGPSRDEALQAQDDDKLTDPLSLKDWVPVKDHAPNRFAINECRTLVFFAAWSAAGAISKCSRALRKVEWARDTRGVSIVCIGGKPRQVECPGFPPP